MEVFEEYAACRDFPVVADSPRLHTLTARTVSGAPCQSASIVCRGTRRVLMPQRRGLHCIRVVLQHAVIVDSHY